jgi:uncharacterized protein YdeI (BOF family)
VISFWPIRAIAVPLHLPIEQARQQPDGTAVIIEGIITVPSGRFASSNLDQGFALQDDSGGIYISTDQQTGLEMGEEVEVRGILADDGHGQRIVQLDTWEQRDRSPQLIAPQGVSVKVAATQLDGTIVTVRGTVSRSRVPDGAYGDRLWLQDATGEIQIYIPKSTHIEPQFLTALQPGQSLEVTGFSSQFDGQDEVMPRQDDDIRVGR